MSFYFGKGETGYTTPKTRSFNSRRDKSLSSEKHSSKRSGKRDDSREADRKPYHRHSDREDKERQRDSYRDRDNRDNRDSSRSKFKNDVMAGANLPKINWSQFELSPFQKDFYKEHPTVRERSQHDIDSFRAEHQIAIRGSITPRPVLTFEEAQFPTYIHEALSKKFKNPTPIQSQGWPAAMAGYDVIGIAQTGSGKTLSFLIPSFVHINAQAPLKPGDGPIGLVLAPTRELAMQIQEECLKFGKYARISSTCVFGGADKGSQYRELSRGNHIVVATPGRLLDFLESGAINLKRVTYLVLDEADRMLDMGFEPQIKRIVSQIRPDRQTLMWSATWPNEVQKLALEFCREKPVHIVVGNNDISVNLRIKQNIEVLDNNMKKHRVVKLLENLMDGSKILIFCQTKRSTDYLAGILGSHGLSAIAIHGDKSQSQRDYIMRQFKTGRSTILVATDLAARGLDVDDIRYVINYDFPTHIEDYIHRVGRTGRAGKSGVSYTFFTREDYKHASKLVDILEETKQVVPDDLYRIARRPIPLGVNSQFKPSQIKNHNSYSTPTDKSTPPPKHGYMPNGSQVHQMGPTQHKEQQQSTYTNPGFFYDYKTSMTPAVPTYNNYTQPLPTQTNTNGVDQTYYANMMNFYNQMQSCYSLNQLLTTMQPSATGTGEQQPPQNMNSYQALNPQMGQQKP